MENQIIGIENLDIIFVDDYSKDATCIKLKEFQKYHPQNVTIIENDKNYGVSYSRNQGIENSHTPYVTFADHDDVLERELLNPLRAFLEHTNEPEPDSPLDTDKLEDHSIEFQDVCFSYQQGKPFLDHLNLKINDGEKKALIGINGAGKTTIIKLLCGFYKPDSGRILIGGKDIANFRTKDLQKLFSTVFQDLYIPPFSVAENVSMQEINQTDKNRVKDCLARADLLDRICSCEKGLDTPMTKEIADGLTLSGGQQQKLLLARALYKNAPILILDEPTAALDPIAESQTYQQFHEITSDKTALYISHRLASTRFCDKIAFLSDGKITEEGTHEELMKNKKAYYEMFTLQSHYYQNGKVEHAYAEK